MQLVDKIFLHLMICKSIRPTLRYIVHSLNKHDLKDYVQLCVSSSLNPLQTTLHSICTEKLHQMSSPMSNTSTKIFYFKKRLKRNTRRLNAKPHLWHIFFFPFFLTLVFVFFTEILGLAASNPRRFSRVHNPKVQKKKKQKNFHKYKLYKDEWHQRALPLASLSFVVAETCPVFVFSSSLCRFPSESPLLLKNPACSQGG